MKFKALLTLALVFAICAPAQARVTLGVVPPANNLIRTDDQAQHFAAYLQRSLGEEVKLRILRDEPTLHNWLNRFREVDVAVVSRAYIERQPAGEFFALSEDFAAGVSGAPLADPVIARQGLSLQLLQRLQYALNAMSQDQGLRNILWPAPAKKPAPPAPAPRKKAAPPVSKVPAKAPEVVKQPQPKTRPEPETTIPVAPGPKQTAQPQAPQVAKTGEKPKGELSPAVQQAPKELSAAKEPEKPMVQKAQLPAPAPEAKLPAEVKKEAPVDPHALAGHQHIDYLFWTGILAATLGALLVIRFVLRLRRQKRIERFSWVPEVSEHFGLNAQQGQPEMNKIPPALTAAGLPGAEKQPAPQFLENQPTEEPEAQQGPDITEESLGLAGLPTPAETPAGDPAMKIPDPISNGTTQPLQEPEDSATKAPASDAQDSALAEEDEAADPLWAAITEIEATKTEPSSEVGASPETCPAPPKDDTEKTKPQAPQPMPSAFEPVANEGGGISAAMEDPEGLKPEQKTEAEFLQRADEPEACALRQAENATLELTASDEQEPALELDDDPEQTHRSEHVQEDSRALEVAASDDEDQHLELDDVPEQSEAPEGFQQEAGALDLAAADEQEQPLALADGPEQSDPSALDQSVLEALEAAAEPPQAPSLEPTKEVADPDPDSLDQGVIEALDAAAVQPEEPLAELETEHPGSPQAYEPDALDLETDQRASDPEATETFETVEEPEPDAAPPGGQTETTKPAEEPVLPAAQTEPLKLNLRGRLGEIQIPALLQLIAPQTRPGSLIITTRHDEKRFHFRNGRISLASSVSRANRSKSGFLMNKVGYLLIRQGTITEEQRDQALELCEKDPTKRIGEALIELGALNRQALMDALRTQAESIIFSLFIFPEGHFEFVYEDFPLQPENDLAIEVPKLLEKASHHETEWNNIREGIPSLATVLDFAESGRQKLASARMTVHQKLVLSLIDGKRPIKEICVAATMLDLEVYKFLFFMVHAKILKRLEPAKEENQLSA